MGLEGGDSTSKILNSSLVVPLVLQWVFGHALDQSVGLSTGWGRQIINADDGSMQYSTNLLSR